MTPCHAGKNMCRDVNDEGFDMFIPIASMCGIYLLIYRKKSTIHVGRYTSPMDGMG